MYALNRTTDADTEPVTTAEAKAHMQISVGFTDDDTMIAGFIKGARYWAEDHTGRAFINQSWTLHLDRWPADGVIALNRCPVSSVTSVKYYDVDNTQRTLVDGTDYQTDVVSIPGRIVVEPGESWPTLESGRLNAIEVIFVAGYGAAASSVHEDIKDALKLLVAHSYEHREEATEGKPLQTIPMGVIPLLSHHVLALI